MRRAFSAIAVFCCFVFFGLPAWGQFSLNDRLLKAAEAGDLAAVQSLLDKGADIEAKNKDGQTALMLAAEHDKPGLIELLLKSGAATEAVDNDGDTAVAWGALAGHADAVRILLENGANVNATDKEGRTALIFAACVHNDLTGAQRVDVTKLLLDKGANIEAKAQSGAMALSCANERGPAELVDELEAGRRTHRSPDLTQSKNPQEQFAAYVKLFQQSPKDEVLRERVIRLSLNFAEPPAIPSAARDLFVLATAQIQQARTPAALDQPIVLLRKAVEVAPWWGNAYFNLSWALEMRGQYDEAAQQLNYYLELKPAEADASEARAHLMVIQAEKEAAAHKAP